MADYVPATIIMVCRNVPLDSTYTDTIKFTSAGAQQGFFAGKAKYTFSENTYQRVNSSVAQPRGPLSLRVPTVADNLYDCNYVCFQNSNFGTKWFYAFIKQVNYINPNNTEIIYELDHYQTWLFDFTVLPSFVEREHTLNDVRFANQQAEPVASPNLLSNTTFDSVVQTFGPPYYIRVWTVTDSNGEHVEGSLQDNIFSGLAYHEFTDAGSANSFLQDYATNHYLENVIGINMAPYSMGSAEPTYNPSFSCPAALNGYTPHNQKCYNYPWNFIRVSDNAGKTMDLTWEGFCEYGVDEQGNITVTPGRAEFAINFARAYNASILLTPKNYLGSSFEDRNFDYQMIINDFPQCAWSGNVFANWLGTELPNRILSLVVGTMASAITPAPEPSKKKDAPLPPTVPSAQRGAIGGLIGGAASIGQEAIMASSNAGKLQGSVGDFSMNMKLDRILFEFKSMCATPEFLIKLDKFFDMYGYATNTVKVPNMEGRESWNYVKTRGVIISGSLPVDAMDRIKAMFDNGVRFWHGDFVGQYNRSNKVVRQ